jgi:hypothetical protein
MRFLIALLALTSVAFAEEPKSWTVDMTTVLTDENHHPIKDQLDRTDSDPSCSKCHDLTLGKAVAHALFFVGGDEKDVTPEQKWAWAAFADKIRDEKTASINNSQGDLIYKRLGKLYNGVVLMRAMPLIDPNRKPPSID